MTDPTPYLLPVTPQVDTPQRVKPVQRAWIHVTYVILDLLLLLVLALDLEALIDANPLQHLEGSGLGLMISLILISLPGLPVFIVACIAWSRIRYHSTKVFARVSFIALGAIVGLTFLLLLLSIFVHV